MNVADLANASYLHVAKFLTPPPAPTFLQHKPLPFVRHVFMFKGVSVLFYFKTSNVLKHQMIKLNSTDTHQRDLLFLQLVVTTSCFLHKPLPMAYLQENQLIDTHRSKLLFHLLVYFA